MNHPDYPRLGRHRLDPVATHAYVAVLAARLADGLISNTDCLLILGEHAHQAGYRGDRSGLRARLAWALADCVGTVTAGRRRAEDDARRAAWQAMDALKPPEAVSEAAQAAAGPLTEAHVKTIVNEVAASWLRQRRYRHG